MYCSPQYQRAPSVTICWRWIRWCTQVPLLTVCFLVLLPYYLIQSGGWELQICMDCVFFSDTVSFFYCLWHVYKKNAIFPHYFLWIGKQRMWWYAGVVVVENVDCEFGCHISPTHVTGSKMLEKCPSHITHLYRIILRSNNVIVSLSQNLQMRGNT